MASCLHNFMLTDHDLRLWDLCRSFFQFLLKQLLKGDVRFGAFPSHLSVYEV